MSPNDRGHLVVFVYPGEHQYIAALLVQAISWCGGEASPEIDSWAVQSLVMLTAPRATLQIGDEQAVVSNGKGNALVLDCSQATL